MEKGFGFYWFPYTKPLLVRPDGYIVVLEVHDDVPYLTDDCEVIPPSGTKRTVQSSGAVTKDSYRGKSAFDVVESWVMDSGSGHDLMTASLAEKRRIRKARAPPRILYGQWFDRCRSCL